MHDLETLKSGGYRGAGLTQLQLRCPLASFPEEILELGDTLEQLDLTGTGLSSLPANLGSALPNLKTALFSNCNFRVFPRELASCAKLETVVFRSNGMQEIPEDALPPRLCELILTNNHLTFLPASIGRCDQLQKCILTGNQLRDLPAGMAQCKRLTVLRLSSNSLSALPPWLFALPELAFLSFASNPCASPATNGHHTTRGLASIPWSDIEVQETLTSTPSSTTSQALWHQSPHYAEDVAVTLFRGSVPTDAGLPADELAAHLAAGAHESLVTLLGRIHSHPEEDESTASPEAELQGALVTQLIPPEYAPLASAAAAAEPPTPTAATPTPAGQELIPPPTHHHQQQQQPQTQAQEMDLPTALQTLTGLAGALAHLHARGIAHGAVCADTILASAADAHALLHGFAAATIYSPHHHHSHPGMTSSAGGQDDEQQAEGEGEYEEGEGGSSIEKIEVLAFGKVMEGLLAAVEKGAAAEQDSDEMERGLRELAGRCVVGSVGERPGFAEVVEGLEGLMGWRGMMRIPDVVPR